MNSYTHYRPDSDEIDGLCLGRVRAERATDVMAAPNSKRHISYLASLDRCPVLSDEEMKRMEVVLNRAVDAYEIREKRFLDVLRVYYHQDEELPFCALPDAVDGFMGITFNVRQQLATYETSERQGGTPGEHDHAQAMMLVTRLPTWGVVNYYEGSGVRKLGKIRKYYYNHHIARDIEDQMLAFILKRRAA